MKFKRVHVEWPEADYNPAIIRCAPVPGKIDRARKIARKIAEKGRYRVKVQTHNFHPLTGEYLPRLEAWLWIAK